MRVGLALPSSPASATGTRGEAPRFQVIAGSIVMDQQLATQVKEAIARSLKLPMAPEDIADDIPLFGEGLGLDSIDVLELVLELERTFNVKITDEQLGRRALRSVRTIVELIEQTRGQAPAETK
jgi:acyl carrier protein